MNISEEDLSFLSRLKRILHYLRQSKYEQFKRHISIQDLLSDRWETAKFYGFGEGSSCYNSVQIFGDVKVGKNVNIGNNVILDGSGGLVIGDNVSITSGVQIWTHSSVKRCVSFGKEPLEYGATKIGSGVYIGPNSILTMGITVGDCAIIGAMSLVNSNVPSGAKFFGAPARDSKSLKS